MFIGKAKVQMLLLWILLLKRKTSQTQAFLPK